MRRSGVGHHAERRRQPSNRTRPALIPSRRYIASVPATRPVPFATDWPPNGFAPRAIANRPANETPPPISAIVIASCRPHSRPRAIPKSATKWAIPKTIASRASGHAPPTAAGATPSPIAVAALPVRKRRNEAARRDPRYIEWRSFGREISGSTVSAGAGSMASADDGDLGPTDDVRVIAAPPTARGAAPDTD